MLVEPNCSPCQQTWFVFIPHLMTSSFAALIVTTATRGHCTRRNIHFGLNKLLFVLLYEGLFFVLVAGQGLVHVSAREYLSLLPCLFSTWLPGIKCICFGQRCFAGALSFGIKYNP